MLRTLLRLAVGQGSTDITALARAVNVTEVQMRLMLDHLKREGYLEEVVPGCERPCERCPLRSACLFRHQPRVWTLTRKGERALGQG